MKKLTIGELQWAICLVEEKHEGLSAAPPEVVCARINDEYQTNNTVEEIKAALDCFNEKDDFELESRRIEYGYGNFD